MVDTNNSNDASETLGAYVRRAREDAGFSQRHLANLVGMHHSRIARLESGEVGDRITPEYLQGIADALDIDRNELLKFIGITLRTELPPVRVYFRRKLGINADEADVLANLITDYQKRNQQLNREEDTDDHTKP